MKKKLLALMAKKNERKQSLAAQAESCEDVATLRSINSEIEALNIEIRDIESMIADVEEVPADDPAAPGVSERTLAINSGVPLIVQSNAQPERRALDEDEAEYRSAFMKHVLSGTPIPTELRANANTLTTDVGTAIPKMLVNRIIEKMETFGMILPLVTKTMHPAGIEIPTSSVKPVATWVSEGATSDRQKKSTGKITFTNFKLRCEISMSMEVSVMSLSAFETAFVSQVAEAMIKAQEQAIINGTGTGQPKGILKETPASGQALQANALSYSMLVDAEAALPQAYENGTVWCMTKKTFMGFIGMLDANKQPVARVNYGIGGKPERILLGREVVLCGDYIDSFSSTLAAGKIFAFLFKFSDYVMNTVYDMGIQRKQDWDTEDILTKAVLSCDGKAIDVNSLVTIAKSA